MAAPIVTIEDWKQLLGRLGFGTAAVPHGDAILCAYGDPGRHYHSLEHLTAVLNVVDELAGTADDPDLVRLAAWYHDVVHEPEGPGGDEERSARMALSDLRSLGIDPASVEEVVRLVELTVTHAPAPDDHNGAVLCDADLWILGLEGDRYDSYVRTVRAEYEHLPAPAWRSGRTVVLKGLLARPAIYHTEAGRRREQVARSNLRRELSRLAR